MTPANGGDGDDSDGDDNAARRTEELEALVSFYGDNVTVKDPQTTWHICVRPKVILELNLPSSYPSGSQPPQPRIRVPHYILDQGRVSTLLEEMVVDLWSKDMEIAIVWAEHLRAALPDEEEDDEGTQDEFDDNAENEEIIQDEGDCGGSISLEERIEANDTIDNKRQQRELPLHTLTVEEGIIRTFVPSSTRFSQPIRRFDACVLANETNRRTIFCGPPYHPPKSGPAETFVAHVASVQCMDHVNWVLGELLLHDKKVAKASHNMMAYRFWDMHRNCMVSDNDDDGEKGSGTKLAALLELSNVNDVMVVVSRWFGGIHLGSARFKYIASTARDALEEAGFINNTSSSNDSTASSNGNANNNNNNNSDNHHLANRNDGKTSKRKGGRRKGG
jgi:putative IMPACT (imprinted ancient) family translation regulator